MEDALFVGDEVMTPFDMQYDKKLPLAAMELFAQMLRIPGKDYATFTEICKFSGKGNTEEVSASLDTLVEHGFLIHHVGKRDVYAVNKQRLITDFKDERK